jgi:hypothetical protein
MISGKASSGKMRKSNIGQRYIYHGVRWVKRVNWDLPASWKVGWIVAQ